MAFEVLSAGCAGERTRWLEAWNASPDREPFAHPTFVELFTRPGETPMLVHFRQPAGGLLLPFILRPLAALPWATEEHTHDLTSPYGYGGPFAWGTAVGDASEFWQAFDAWCREHSVVSSFLRLGLFEAALPVMPEKPAELFGNVVRDLRLTPDELWKDYAHKVRKNVNRARKSGLEVIEDLDGALLPDFLSIYESTMQRRDAQDEFLFGAAFFERIVTEMRDSFAFFHVEHQGRVVSTELVLTSANYLYSFLGGTLADAFDLRPNDLLKHHVMRWGQELGKHAFVLGGGYGSEDGIFRYKLAFAPSGSTPFRVLKRTHDPNASKRLAQLRAEHTPGWQPRADFFPGYRG